MESGIRAEVRVESPATCPVAMATERADAATYSVSRSTDPADTGVVAEEFTLDAGADLDPESLTTDDVDAVRKVFAYGNRDAYRFERRRGAGCPCECVERFDAPVVDLHAREGTLFLTFHATSMDELSDVLDAVRETYPSMAVRRLLRSEADHEEQDLVFVDRSRLTERQREVLRTAHEMGYFAHPKEANAGDVADELGISPATLSEHLAAAQRKLLDAVVES